MNHRCEMPMLIPMFHRMPHRRPNRRPKGLRALAVLLILGLGIGLAGSAAAWEGTFELRSAPTAELAPPLPPTDLFPVQLLLDDDLQEGAFGVTGAGGALQFLWFNRFTRPPGVEDFDLAEIWVLFPGVPEVSVGDPIQLVVYRDPDGDPTNGAELLAAFDETVQVADDLSFSVYSLPASVSVPAGGDVLIGVVNRFVTSGVTPPVSPATLDLTASQGRSWFALWSADPPDPPTLPGDVLTTRIDDFNPNFAGNWMIRGFGTGPGALEIPTVSPLGLGLLALLLTVAAAVLLRRRRGGLAVLAILTLVLGLPAAAQTTVDDFSTNQAEITAPPTATSTVAGAGILGGNRDLLVSATASAGLTSGSVPEGASSAARVDAGVLNFDALPSGPRTVQVTWDGDSDPDALDPVGLGGVDLTTGGASAFVFALASTADIQLEVEVFTDGSNSSFAARLVPMGAADIYVDFSEMAPAQGTGADFTNVGAIVLTLRLDSAAATLDSVLTAVPDPAALKTDALTVDGDSDGDADPGDRLTYTIIITNNGAEARTVDVADTVDGNTTLVMGSVDATPVAKGDQYRAVGNVTLLVDGTPGKPGLLANDTDPDGGAVMVASVDAMSAQGGSVSNLNPATGTFDYVPPAGFRGVDSFGYMVQDDEGNMQPGVATVSVTGIVWFVDNTHAGPFEGTQANPFDTMKSAEMASAPRDIIRVREGDGTDTGHSLGFICKPGQRIVGGAADLIIGGQLIEAGAGYSQHSHGAGNVFDLAGDHIIEGVELNPTTGHGLGGTGTSEVVVDNSIINPAGSADAVRLTNHSGVFTFSNSSITDANSSTGVAVRVVGGGGTFNFTGSPIAQQGGGLVHVSGTTNADFDFIGSAPTLSSGTDDGLNLQNNTGGDFLFDNLGTITTTAGNGILVANSGTLRLDQVSAVSAVGGAAVNITGTTVVKVTPLAPPLRGGADITFPSLTSSNGAIGVNLVGVAPSVAVSGTTSVTNSGAGVNLESSGAVTFNSLTVNTTAGAGLRANATGTVTVTDNTSTVSATGGPGVDITGTPVNMLLATLSSTNSTGRGLSFSGASGTLNAAGGSITGVPNGNRGVSVNGGSLGLTYGGTVTYTANDYAVRIQDTSAGFATFNAKVSGAASSLGIYISNADSNATFADLDLGTSGSPMTNTGVQLINGSLGTFSFADTQIFTNGAQGIVANNGGVVQVTGSGNRVSATNARAITFESGTTIGGAGVTFERVDASGADRGIRLAGAGSGFTVTGDGVNGTDGSGGTIASITQRGIEVLSTNSVTLRNLTMNNAATTDAPSDCTNLVNTGCHAAIHLGTVTTAVLDNVDIDGSVQQGINGAGVDGLSLQNSTVTAAGDEVNEGCFRIIGLTGTSDITASDLSFASERVALVENTDAANLALTVTGSTFRDTQSSGVGADGLELNFLGSSSATIDVVNSFFLRNRTNGLQVFSQGTSIVGADITGSTFDRGAGIGIGMDLAASDTGSLTFNVIGNPVINSNGGSSVNVFADNSSTIAGRINNNPNIQAGGGMTSGFGISVQVNESASGVVEISNNVVSNIGVDAGIRVISRLLGGPACGTTCTDGRLDATVVGNSVTIGSDGLYDVWVQANDSNTLCADVRTNAGSGAGIAAFRERTNAAASTVLLEGFVTDAAATWAANGNTPAGSVSSSNNGTLQGGTCTDVSHPMP
ncbi:MAG: Ig-like domain-containing protein [Acidobacteriota bacterium]|nr:Ig-like domain-containing protein [Acidobacteriota bacterium]